MSEFSDLEAIALRVREHIIRMSTGGGCFIGASLSCADLLVFLYARVLNVSPETVEDPDRDYLLLSKGHDVPALYGTLAERGFFAPARLDKHLQPDDLLYWHPNRAIPGVEFHSGSLGHLLSVGMGIATDIKLRSGRNRVYVVVGDGELNEGSMWEAMLVASARRLDNLVMVIDRNEFQANVRTEELIPLEPLAAKLEAFGFETTTFDGHSFEAMERAFDVATRSPVAKHSNAWSVSHESISKSASATPSSLTPVASNAEHRNVQPQGPRALIARTVRGKGLPSIEERADRWFVNFRDEEVEQLLGELHGEAQAKLTSETLTVR